MRSSPATSSADQLRQVSQPSASECDLFLTCPKFLTTTEYAPRLKERLVPKRKLAHDALRRGWPREAERHGATANRINQLPDKLDQAIDK